MTHCIFYSPGRKSLQAVTKLNELDSDWFQICNFRVDEFTATSFVNHCTNKFGNFEGTQPEAVLKEWQLLFDSPCIDYAR